MKITQENYSKNVQNYEQKLKGKNIFRGITSLSKA